MKMTDVIRMPVVVAFLLGVFLTLVVFVTAFFLGEVTAERRGGILVAAATLATRTSTPTEMPTVTPTTMPTDTPTATPTSTSTPEPTDTPPPPTNTPVLVLPTAAALAAQCTSVVDARIGLDTRAWGSREVRLSRGQEIRVSIAVYGYDRTLEFYVSDRNATELLHRRLAGAASVQFVAPYDDTYALRAFNPSWFGKKTVDLRWQVCGA
jgi:hypothetical protein